ncbi:MAG: GPN-loop GTPase 3, partial [Paramarteilia canceri]
YCEKSKDLMKINPCLTPYTRNCQYLEKKYPQLIESIASILENFDLVIFYKMSLKKSRMISKLLTRINLTIQYDEYRESKNLDIET